MESVSPHDAALDDKGPRAGQWIGSEEPPLSPVCIWDYTDYRAYLRDSFSAARAMGNPVSNRWLARRLGFKSFSFITMLLQGKRNLTRPNRERFARLLGLDAETEAYFAALVEYNQARLVLDKERALQTLAQMRRPGPGRAGETRDLRLTEEGFRRVRDLLEEFRLRAEGLEDGGEGALDYRLDLRLFPLAAT